MLELDIDNKIVLFSCDALDLNFISKNKSYYRVLYILEGHGTAILDVETYGYQTGSFFLIPPQQTPDFDPNVRTDILVMVFIDFRATLSKAKQTIDGLDSLFRYVRENVAPMNYEQGEKIRDAKDRNAVNNLVNMMLVEMQQSRYFSKEIIMNSISLMILILVRNLTYPMEPAVNNRYDPETSRILEYVKFRIQENKKVTINEIAIGIRMSDYNLNRAIIKGTGTTLKSFIAKYKMGFSEEFFSMLA